MACVDVRAFALQLLCRRHPDWKKKNYPVVVVNEDRPQGVILAVNEEARKARILPGFRYAQGLAMATNLRAGEVLEAEISRSREELSEQLRTFSPEVEPYRDDPGVYWLDGEGLGRIHKTPMRWARAILDMIRKERFLANIVVGFSRFPTYAIAKDSQAEVMVLRTPAEEHHAVRRVPLERLELDPRLRDDLARLGIVDIGGFVRLPSGALAERFGSQARSLHDLATGQCWDPLRPEPERPLFEQAVILDNAETNSIRLLFLVKRALGPLLLRLAERGLCVANLFIHFVLDQPEERHRLDSLRPAEPTLDPRSLLSLVHLRLEAKPVPAGVIEMTVSVEETRASREQLGLFAEKPRRDLRAANDAFARLRAEYGDRCVVKAVLGDGHLPEARFGWEILDHVVSPHSKVVETRSLVRRIWARPVLLPPQNPHVRDDGWLLRGLEHGPVVRLIGPYTTSGGWWRKEICREYHFAETRKGDWLWVYYDRRRRRWFLHGQVR